MSFEVGAVLDFKKSPVSNDARGNTFEALGAGRPGSRKHHTSLCIRADLSRSAPRLRYSQPLARPEFLLRRPLMNLFN